MPQKATAEGSKTHTSSTGSSRSSSAQPLLQAKAAEASSGLGVFVGGESSSPLSRLIQSSAIQTRLSIGAPNDRFEQEADRVADHVLTLSNTGKAAPRDGAESIPSNAAVQAKISIQKIPLSAGNLLSRVPEENEEEVQAKGLVQSAFMDLDDEGSEQGEERVAAKFLQASQAGETTTSAGFESSLLSSKGSGSPLPAQTRSEMESGIGADFSGVRIHTDSNAVQMNQDINARAFTHGSDIYFNQGQYDAGSSSGKHLIAHELTHTVQQGASVQTKPGISTVDTTRTQSKIQRGWLGDAWDSVSSAASSAVDWAADQLNEAKNWAKNQLIELVQGIPGYKLLSVVLGQDPISGSPVARDGRNFIEAGLDIIPFGALYQRKLEETGAMEEAATWLDAEMAKVDISLSAILAAIGRFWESLSVTDLADIPAVLSRATNIIRQPISKVITFARNLAVKLLQIVKNAVLSSLVSFIKNHTRGYPLLTVILGRDPITEEAVERTGMNLIKGFMLLSESGEEQLRQMEESGALQRAADWIDGAVARLDLTLEAIQGMFRRAWDLVSISSLMDPVGTFQELANIFLEPAGRIVNFVVEVSIKILGFIKDALVRLLVNYARTVRGYPLLTVILGKDPFSGEPVVRNTENIVHGFMSLMDGGEEQFQEMKASGAIARMSSKVEAAMAQLNFTWAYIRGLFVVAWESLTLLDLAVPALAFVKVVDVFSDVLLRLIAFIWEIVKIVIEVILTLMNFPFKLINNIITRSMEAVEDIKKDPIGFLKNIIRAMKQGFVQFFANIFKHLLNGVVDWLFGELGDAGITPPKDLSFGSILGLVLEILGITIDKIWAKLAEKIGQDKVDRVRSMIDKLTGIWTFVKDVMERGVVAIWEYIADQLSNLWSIVLNAISQWIVTKIITQVTAKLLSMLDPTGIMAVINGAIAFYNAVQSFIQYLREMLEIVNSFVVGVAEIAKGDVSRAANFLEAALAKGIPIAIGFLANQVGLGGLGRRIGEMIDKVRDMVDQALDWLVDKAVSAGSAVLNMGKNAVGAIKNWWQSKKVFSTEDGESHTLLFRGEDKSAKLMLESDPVEIGQWLVEKRAASLPPAKKSALDKVASLVKEADAIRDGTATSPRTMDAVLSELSTNIQAVMGSDVLAEAKEYKDFKTADGWFAPGTLKAFIMQVGGVSESTAQRRINDWKKTDIGSWESGPKDGNKKFSFVHGNKDRKVPQASRRTIYGFGSNIPKDSSDGWKVMEKTLDKTKSERQAIASGYKTEKWARDNPGWINSALSDADFQKTHAIFNCARQKHARIR